MSYVTGRSIRLVRAVPEGYRYDGMYRIRQVCRSFTVLRTRRSNVRHVLTLSFQAYMAKGKSGYAVCRFEFEVWSYRLSPAQSVH